MLEGRLRAVQLNQIKILDSFWEKHISLVENAIIPYQWDAMNDNIPDAESSHCIENFRIAAGEKAGKFYGAVFQDTDIAKWLEAVGCSLASRPDPKLMQIADEMIELIGKAQQDDGYINTYFTIEEPEGRWSNLTEGHELYTAGHLIEAAVAYYYGTGKRRFADIMCRFADLICETFGEGKAIQGYPGHQEIELALIKLYYLTGKKAYLETAKYFIDIRGTEPNYFLEEIKKAGHKFIFPEFEGYLPLYSQSHLPVREQKTAEGHAVRAAYMYCAMADLAYEYKDKELFQACETLWNNIVQKRMYITGSIGASGLWERFTTDYDLPNDCNYSETCASIGLALFGMRMAQITQDAKYVEVMERALYNTMLAGIALDGKSFFYVNPLEVWPDNCLPRTSKEHVKPIRQKWFGVACCPPNIARTLASMGQYIYAVGEDGICINLFIGNESKVQIGDAVYDVKIQSEFPIKNHFSVIISGENPMQYIRIRIPEYAKNYKITCGDKEISYRVDKGYAVLDGSLLHKQMEVEFEAPAAFVRANPLVRADAGKVCIKRGPLVYALEGRDNGSNLSGLYIDTNQTLEERYEPDELGGIVAVYGKAKRLRADDSWKETLYSDNAQMSWEEVQIRAIPYPYWNNRGMDEMCVWMKELFS